MDFYEDPYKTSLNIFENIEKFILQSNLDPELLSEFSADNTSVNYDIQKLLGKHTVTKIIRENCNVT